MNAKANAPTDVGIIVGRFQVHELHEAHKDLIDTVLNKHERVIIFVGLSPLRNTATNPLDFNTRKRMIQESYPNIEVYYIDDVPSNTVWSKNLDREISRWLKPYQTVTLYGSRDSFIPAYSGKYPVQELESTKYISGTELRRRISNNYPPTIEFRAGAISASMNRYPTCYTTVDVAVIDHDKGRILLGRKEGETNLRFIGGFASPQSPSYENDARREVMEETGISVDDITYVGSTIIDDWRYRNEVDVIKTMFFVATYQFGRPEADDDIQYVEWVSLVDLLDEKIKVVDEHVVLVDMLKRHIKSQKSVNVNTF